MRAKTLFGSATALLFLMISASALAPVAGALDGEAIPAAAKKKRSKQEVVHLTEWPKPADKAQVALDIERLCKARTPEMALQARESLEATGDPTVPFLLERMGKERDEAAVKRIREVLITNTKAAHTRLMAKEFEDRSESTRIFTLWRCAAFPDKEIRPAVEAAWTRLKKLGDKAAPEELYAAALCAASTGSVVGLEVLHAAALKSWERRGVEIRAAIEGSRGPEATKLEVSKLDGADQKQKVAVLRMLAGCGDATALPAVRRFLDDDDNQIRVAAINACRGIVDGDPPLEQLPVFEAIETAKKWKDRAG
ncbi:MAG: hypothetical protein ACKVXR_15295 [Planctomycetota bacterium]